MKEAVDDLAGDSQLDELLWQGGQRACDPPVRWGAASVRGEGERTDDPTGGRRSVGAAAAAERAATSGLFPLVASDPVSDTGGDWAAPASYPALSSACLLDDCTGSNGGTSDEDMEDGARKAYLRGAEDALAGVRLAAARPCVTLRPLESKGAEVRRARLGEVACAGACLAGGAVCGAGEAGGVDGRMYSMSRGLPHDVRWSRLAAGRSQYPWVPLYPHLGRSYSVPEGEEGDEEEIDEVEEDEEVEVEVELEDAPTLRVDVS